MVVSFSLHTFNGDRPFYFGDYDLKTWEEGERADDGGRRHPALLRTRRGSFRRQWAGRQWGISLRLLHVFAFLPSFPAYVMSVSLREEPSYLKRKTLFNFSFSLSLSPHHLSWKEEGEERGGRQNCLPVMRCAGQWERGKQSPSSALHAVISPLCLSPLGKGMSQGRREGEKALNNSILKDMPPKGKKKSIVVTACLLLAPCFLLLPF